MTATFWTTVSDMDIKEKYEANKYIDISDKNFDVGNIDNSVESNFEIEHDVDSLEDCQNRNYSKFQGNSY